MFVAKQKKVLSPWMKLAPEAPKESGITCVYTDLYFLPQNPSSNPRCFFDFFCIIEARSSMTQTNRDLCHGEKKLPMILFSTCFKRWAPQETRQNEGSSHVILGKKWSCQFFFGPQTMVGLATSSIESTLMAWPCQIFVHKNVDGKHALVRLSAFRSSWAV